MIAAILLSKYDCYDTLITTERKETGCLNIRLIIENTHNKLFLNSDLSAQDSMQAFFFVRSFLSKLCFSHLSKTLRLYKDLINKCINTDLMFKRKLSN